MTKTDALSRETFMYGIMDDTVNIPKTEYDELLRDSRWAAALEQAGVDNWEGYDLARDIFDAFE